MKLRCRKCGYEWTTMQDRWPKTNGACGHIIKHAENITTHPPVADDWGYEA